jgi:Domain of unknown function (DU1801)
MAEKKSKLVEIKTKPTTVSVDDFINAVTDEQKRRDCFVLAKMMQKATGNEPVLWGNSIIGFGNKRYKSAATGRETDWFRIGFSPRKANLSLYLIAGIKVHAPQLEKLGKHKVSGGCLHISKLDDINLKVLEVILHASAKQA